MRIVAVLTVVLTLISGVCLADEGDDTLRAYLAKSDLVVLGTITSEPAGIIDEIGVVNYSCQFKVSEVCKGDTKLKGKTIKVNIMRFEMDKMDHHPLIKKNAECILFLKKTRRKYSPVGYSRFLVWHSASYTLDGEIAETISKGKDCRTKEST